MPCQQTYHQIMLNKYNIEEVLGLNYLQASNNADPEAFTIKKLSHSKNKVKHRAPQHLTILFT